VFIMGPVWLLRTLDGRFTDATGASHQISLVKGTETTRFSW